MVGEKIHSKYLIKGEHMVRRNKKIISISVFVTIIVLSFILVLIFQGGKINLSEVQSIIITADKTLSLDITDLNDINIIGGILDKRFVNDSPSCPFGYVKIVFHQKADDIIIYPATDGCHIFKDIDHKYFRVSDTEWEQLMEIFKKYGIDRSLFESGK